MPESVSRPVPTCLSLLAGLPQRIKHIDVVESPMTSYLLLLVIAFLLALV